MIPNKPFLSQVDERYRDFIAIRVSFIEELQCFFREIQHIPSGATILHIECDDPENLFCLSFKTLPKSSNGAPHILEHTVLCGSRKYPIKDPFFAMMRRSLNTFMNALTGADFTCYPAASLVEKDFYNLLEVYLDAVFHPKLTPLSFMQEGYRLEFQKADDPSTPLEIKGIVYNEMKGSLSSPDARLWHEMLKHLTPDLTYAYNSGGDPEQIPHLRYEELINFYDTYYHPSRCLFFFYGNLPLQKHLDFIEEKALHNVVKQPHLEEEKRQKRFSHPKSITAFYPTTEEAKESAKAMVAFGYLTTSIENQDELLALCVLDSILMDTDASPLKLALLGSKLCTQAEAFIDTEMSEVPYLILLKGCQKEDLDALEKVIQDTLKDLVEKGIPKELIDSSIHQLELTRSELSSDHTPFGLTLFMRSALAKQHGCDPTHALMIHLLFERLLQQAKDPRFFPRLIEKHLLTNPHLVRLVMLPDPYLSEEEESKEKKRLETIKQNLSQKEVEEIIKTASKLRQYQEMVEHQDIECLPKVTLADVPIQARDFPLKESMHASIPIYYHESFTNQILYCDVVFNLPQISQEDIPYLHLLTSLLPEIGSKGRSYTQTLEALHAHTGGFGLACSHLISIDNPENFKPILIVKGKALHRKVDKFFPLMWDMLTSAKFDEKSRIEELIHQIHTALQSKINKNAHRYAMQLALATLTPSASFNHYCYGLPFFQFIKDLVKELPSQIDALVAKLVSLYQQLFNAESASLIIACEEKTKGVLEKHGYFGLERLPHFGHTRWQNTLQLPEKISQVRLISAPVAFNVEAYSIVGYSHPYSPALLVASQLLENKVLHPKIREQGGAYGSGANYNSMAATFCFHSYRDPNMQKTYETFEASLHALAQDLVNDKELEEAKLGILQGLDAPLSPISRAFTAFSWQKEGKTLAIRKQYREAILKLTAQDIKEAIQNALLTKLPDRIRVSFAGKALIEKEGSHLEKNGKELAVYPL